jgi:hypothetical protein
MEIQFNKSIYLSNLQGSKPRNSVSTGAERGLVKSQSSNCDGLVNANHFTFPLRGAVNSGLWNRD